MALGPTKIERMDDRMDAIAAALVAALPARHVKRSWLRSYDAYDAQELADGVVVLISAGEDGYKQGSMRAREGTHAMILIGYLKVGDDELPQAIEAAELDLAEEIKGFVRAGVAGVGLEIESAQHSRQLEHPYGWVVAHLHAGAMGSTIS